MSGGRLDLDNWDRYMRYITILFFVSLVGLSLHGLDDALVTREPAWYSIGVGEFLFYLALIYYIVPPLGLLAARRGHIVGLGILALYSLQAFYGAGVNHVRHLFGNFQGSQLLPHIFTALGIDYAPYLTGHGFLSLITNMAGLGVTPPHTHTLASDVVVFFNIGLNLVLMYYLALAGREWWRIRAQHTPLVREPHASGD
ncbi:MAG: hypothetical protein M1482_10545 [Chloroflexi bacterium]|nr:hypothetical protein [Chloroflexota bacterium]